MRKQIFEQIEKRCQEQDLQWGGKDHDDHHLYRDWISFICKFLGKASDYPFNAYKFHDAMLDIAALAVQSLSWNERVMLPKRKKEKLEALEALEKLAFEKHQKDLCKEEDCQKTTEYLNDR